MFLDEISHSFHRSGPSLKAFFELFQEALMGFSIEFMLTLGVALLLKTQPVRAQAHASTLDAEVRRMRKSGAIKDLFASYGLEDWE